MSNTSAREWSETSQQARVDNNIGRATVLWPRSVAHTEGPNKGKHNAINPTQCIKEKIKTPTMHLGSSNYFFGWLVIFLLC